MSDLYLGGQIRSTPFVIYKSRRTLRGVQFRLTSDPAIFYRTSPGIHFPTNDIVRRVTKGYSPLDLVVPVSVGRDLNHSISLCPVICSTERSFSAPTNPRFSYEQPRAYLSYCAEHTVRRNLLCTSPAHRFCSYAYSNCYQAAQLPCQAFIPMLNSLLHLSTIISPPSPSSPRRPPAPPPVPPPP